MNDLGIVLSRQVSDATRQSPWRSQSPTGCKPCGDCNALRMADLTAKEESNGK